jgi:lipoprotein signal peptidase
METVQLEQIANNLMAKLEPTCVEVLNQGANFVATEALYSIFINIIFFIVCFISIRLAKNIKDRDIKEITIILLLVGAFLTVVNFLLTFSRNIAIIQYPMGHLLLEILK